MLTALASLTLALTSCTTIIPLTAGSGNVGEKRGEATVAYLFGFIPLQFSDDSGILKAAKDGDITHVATVDVKKFSVLGIYTSKTTIVTGD